VVRIDDPPYLSNTIRGAHPQLHGPWDWVAVVQHDRDLTLYQDFTQDDEALDIAFKHAAISKKPVACSIAGGRRIASNTYHLLSTPEEPQP
jgi:hypothetical protein